MKVIVLVSLINIVVYLILIFLKGIDFFFWKVYIFLYFEENIIKLLVKLCSFLVLKIFNEIYKVTRLKYKII